MDPLPKEQPVPSLRDQIEQEITKTKGGLVVYMDHFSMMLPPISDDDGLTNYRTILKNIIKAWEIPHSEIYKGRDLDGWSKLKINQTPKEFFDTIDQTLTEAGADLERIKQFKIDIRSGKSKVEELYGYCKEGYIRIREKGYTWTDLD